MAQVGATEVCSSQIRPALGVGHIVEFGHRPAAHIQRPQVGAAQVGPCEDCVLQARPSKRGATKICVAKVCMPRS